MPSIFARSRTASTPGKLRKAPAHNGGLPASPMDAPDEFGRVTSRGSAVHSPASKKDKKKDIKAAARLRTQSSPQDTIDTPSIPDGSFLPFSWGLPESSEEPRTSPQKYGYMSYHCEVVLGLEEVTRLVEVISNELSQRGMWWAFATLDDTEMSLIGLTTPLLFSNHAIDISPTRIKHLIDSFLRTCGNDCLGSSADLKWREEAQFSGPHELAMSLRWGLARIVRISQGQETRGIISWESYLRWREDEGGAFYDAMLF